MLSRTVVKVYGCTCERCGHTWESTKKIPLRCAKCKSVYWNVPRSGKYLSCGKVSVTLNEVIAEFKLLNPKFADQREALDMCGTLSDRFKQFALDRGVRVATWSFNAFYPGENLDPEIYQARMNESGDTPCEWHVVVDAGMFFIDWSVRQYTLKTEYPHIIVKKDGVHL